jgi:putative ABC transport system ATP-binding protein
VPLIEIRGLSKLYRMGDSVVRALDGVDLEIEQGEFVAITGASGSGKSTMMHLLGCLDRPTSGQYLLDGRDVGRLSDHDLAAIRNRKIGFVFQTFNLINRTTAVENVAVPLFYSRKTALKGPALQALERVGLKERAGHQPSELSGGERQRVAIARAIVNDPLLLMADEPTGNLDSRTGAQIMRIFHDLNAQGVTIVMVTHEPEIAEQARRIVQMRDGKIVADRRGGPWREPGELVDDEAEEATPESGPTATTGLGTASGVGLAPALTETETQAATQVAPSETAHDYAPAGAPVRVIPGATAALGCGVAALVVFVLAIGSQFTMGVLYREEFKALQSLQPGDPRPAVPAVAMGVMMGATLAHLASLILAILAMVFGRGAWRRLRREFGEWTGRGRIMAGMVTGGLPLLIYLAMLVWTGILVARRLS